MVTRVWSKQHFFNYSAVRLLIATRLHSYAMNYSSVIANSFELSYTMVYIIHTMSAFCWSTVRAIDLYGCCGTINREVRNIGDAEEHR